MVGPLDMHGEAAKFFDEHCVHDVGILSVNPRSGVVGGSASDMAYGRLVSIEHDGIRFYGRVA